MSPYCASVRLRGIGVAVITSRSARSPFAPRSMRWRTPKRCCSSTTARRRSRKATSFWKSAWVPTRMSISPAASAASRAARSAPLSRPVRMSSRTPAASASGCSDRRCWRARISVGAISAAWPPASTAASMARSATTVLPAPTSPCSSRFIRFGRAHVGGDLRDAARLRAGQRVGQRGDHLRPEPAVAAGGEALGPLQPGAGDRERQLVGEELVVGEALAGRRGRREVRRAFGGVGGGERGVPVRPAAPALQARLDPLGQRPDALERGADGAGHRLQGQPLGERVDRLELGQRPRRLRGGGCGRGGPSGRCRRRARPGRRRCGGCRPGASGAASRGWDGRRRAGTRSARRGRAPGTGGCGRTPAGAARPRPRR